MRHRLTTHLRGNAVAYLALFVALTSTSVAAVGVGRNSVRSEHIRNGQIKYDDLARDTVDSTKVKDRTLRKRDFARGVLVTGPTGPQGPQGPLGPQGPPGLGGPITGADVTDDSLTGADIAESTLSLGRTRSVSLPIASFVDCDTSTGTLLDFASGAGDRVPDFGRNSPADGSGFHIAFDDDTGNEDERFDTCAQLTVPADYASGGQVQVRAAQPLGASAPVESIRCRFAIDGNVGLAAAATAISAQPSTSYTCSPALPPLAPGTALTVNLAMTTGVGPPDMNDPVQVQSVAFVYGAAG